MVEDKERTEKSHDSNTPKKPSGVTDTNPVTPIIESPKANVASDSGSSPARYAGKFDPKAIAKKAVASSVTVNALGKDLSIPDLVKTSTVLPSPVKGFQADMSPTAFIGTSKGMF